ncbi:MAG: hypothetical protein TREMPRED_000502 [Tremellales sp. Tagirdzhanova-0007]|nr:MAG: hypothetical protein TREMPRED_000502 [Tremellales sp. Tagirdzhanova-0007]
MPDRLRAEIEEKKAKLAELRRARDERKVLLAQAEKGPVEPLTTSRKDVNDLVESLLGPGARPASPYQTASLRVQTPSSSATPLPTSGAGRSTPPASIPGTPGGRNSRMSNGSSGQEGRRAIGLGQAMGDREGMGSPFQPSVDYIDHKAELYELPAKAFKPITYSKAIQTSTSMSTSTSDLESNDEDDNVRRRMNRESGIGRETEDDMRKRILEELEEERRKLELDLRDVNESKAKMEEQKHKISDLTTEQRQVIFAAPDFSAFIEESTRIVQRALSDGYDYIKNYTVGVDGDFVELDGQKVKLVCAFSDERWTSGRSVTDIDWSSKFPELVVASYNKSPFMPSEPDGIVAVWNLHLLERPEFVFHSASDVLSVCFSPFHPNLIFGGSYSGQVLLWDTRAKHLPVLKTPLSAAGHTYPIYAMKMVGTQNANNLISSSTDGLVCSWLADMLAQPQEALSLTVPSNNKTDDVSITCLDFPDNQTSTFWIGTEEGSIYQANRYDRASAKAGLVAAPDDIYRGHAGPVTGLHVHPSTGSIDLSDLFLTSSVDWTVKLWGAKAGTKQGGGVAPIHSFEEADDYVFDVKWHPNHPATFGTVDGAGKFDLWNLNQDVEVPIVSTQVSSRAINRLAWDRNPLSRKAGLGSSDGKVYVYDIAERLVSPRENEWTEMQKMVQALVANRDAGAGMGVSSVPEVSGGRYR